ncbi:MAG: hypothetical protein ACREGA_00185 [Candidatus Saccharimonadales bacterium]
MGNGDELGNSPMPNLKPSIEEVDTLADELAGEFDNPDYRTWYCKVIYEFGVDRVNGWRKRARSGDFPGRLFGFYVREARERKGGNRSVHDNASQPTANGKDTVYPVRGDETSEELLANMQKTLGEKPASQEASKESQANNVRRVFGDYLEEIDA